MRQRGHHLHLINATGAPYFPDRLTPDPTGLVAIGGTLAPECLTEAYAKGIFPWHSQPVIAWFSPDPRYVLFPGELHIPRSLRRVLNRGTYTFSLDRAFREVMTACADTPRPDEDGTWITPDMIDAYCRLHEMGLAHSVEAWRDGELAGGLYGVALGGVFCGESMFARYDNASKAAFAWLVQHLAESGFALVDCQVHTEHLERFGARHIPRAQFLSLLDAANEPFRANRARDALYALAAATRPEEGPA